MIMPARTPTIVVSPLLARASSGLLVGTDVAEVGVVISSNVDVGIGCFVSLYEGVEVVVDIVSVLVDIVSVVVDIVSVLVDIVSVLVFFEVCMVVMPVDNEAVAV